MVNALIVADGDVPAREAVHRVLESDGPPGETLVIAADGGALKAELIGLRPDVVVGDLDSLSPDTVDRLHAGGVEVQAHPRAKDESDLELAVREALARGATRLVILGALGGLRVEHTLANLLLLTLPELDACDVVLVDGPSSVRVIGGGGPDQLELVGHPGDYVSLLPLSGVVTGVKTSGLLFALDGNTLAQGPTRGLSNEMTGERATIATGDGRLAVVHTRIHGEPQSDE